MKTYALSNALGNVGDDLIISAYNCGAVRTEEKNNYKTRKVALLVAAAILTLSLIVSAAAFALANRPGRITAGTTNEANPVATSVLPEQMMQPAIIYYYGGEEYPDGFQKPGRAFEFSLSFPSFAYQDKTFEIEIGLGERGLTEEAIEKTGGEVPPDAAFKFDRKFALICFDSESYEQYKRNNGYPDADYSISNAFSFNGKPGKYSYTFNAGTIMPIEYYLVKNGPEYKIKISVDPSGIETLPEGLIAFNFGTWSDDAEHYGYNGKRIFYALCDGAIGFSFDSIEDAKKNAVEKPVNEVNLSEKANVGSCIRGSEIQNEIAIIQDNVSFCSEKDSELSIVLYAPVNDKTIEYYNKVFENKNRTYCFGGNTLIMEEIGDYEYDKDETITRTFHIIGGVESEYKITVKGENISNIEIKDLKNRTFSVSFTANSEDGYIVVNAKSYDKDKEIQTPSKSRKIYTAVTDKKVCVSSTCKEYAERLAGRKIDPGVITNEDSIKYNNGAKH